MDSVFIEDLRIETVIGIYDWERKIRQVVALDLEMAFDNRVPTASDRIEDTLNYKAVSKRLITFVESSTFQLVETLAERCAAIVLDEFSVAWLRLRLAKPGAVRGTKSVGVTIERGREAGAMTRVYLSARFQHRAGKTSAYCIDGTARTFRRTCRVAGLSFPGRRFRRA